MSINLGAIHGDFYRACRDLGVRRSRLYELMAVGNYAALRQLPVRWRALTLVVLQDLFGPSLSVDAVMPDAARNLFRRAAPQPVRMYKGAGRL